MFVWASLELVLGIGFLFVAQFVPEELLGGMRVLMNLGVPAVKQAGLLLGTSSLIGAFFNVVIAFLGIRGSENPVRIAPFFWIALIDAVVIAWALASSITQGVIDPVSIVSSLFVIMLAVGAWKVRKQTGYFDRHP
jgi:hypothetical protein